MDLEGEANTKMDLGSEPPYPVHRGWKYSQTAKVLIPIRKRGPKNEIPMTHAGCLQYMFFSWITSLMWKIYKKGIGVLEGIHTAYVDSTECNIARMERLWREELKAKGPKKASLPLVVLRSVRTRLIISLIFLFLFMGFSLANPAFVIHSLLKYLASGDIRVEMGLAYVAVLVVCEFLRSVCTSTAWGINYQSGVRVRNGLTGLVFKKILNLKNLKNKTVGELVNMVGNDGQRLFEAVALGPLICCGPIILLGGSIYSLFLLGPWSLLGSAIFVGFYPFSTVVSRITTKLRQKGIVITDKRVRMMTELLSCINLIKMYAWEKSFAKTIADIRRSEQKVLQQGAFVQSISMTTATMVPTLASALTFIAMVCTGTDLQASEAFTYIALLNSMRFALGVVPFATKALSESAVSLKRFKEVLVMEEMQPVQGEVQDPKNALEIVSASFTWDSDVSYSPDAGDITNGKLKGKDKNGDAEELQKLNAANGDAPISKSEPHLQEISIIQKKGELIGVCGSVGSGKSSLISAVLGRMTLTSGRLGISGRVAYVSQQAWILNRTCKENILFGLPYDETRYKAVVEACCLTEDFKSFVAGDETEIGERGINLSGGQKQRISLARAVYSDSDLYLLDDPLSAVDVHIGRHIFDQCIMGALKGKTVLFVTHQLQYLYQCHHVVCMKEGRVMEQGSHEELLALQGSYAQLLSIYNQEHSHDAPASPGLQPQDSVQNNGTAAAENPDGSPVQRERTLSSSSTRKPPRVQQQQSILSVRSTDSKEPKNDGKLIVKEEMMAGKIGWRIYRTYAKQAGGVCVSFITLFIFLLAVAGMSMANWFLSYWFNQGDGRQRLANMTDSGNWTSPGDTMSYNQTGGDNSSSSIFTMTTEVPDQPGEVAGRGRGNIVDNPRWPFYTSIYGSLVGLMIVMTCVRAFIFTKVTLRASSRLHDMVFAKILACPVSFFQETPLGRIINRFSVDMDELDVRLPMTAEMFFNNILLNVFSLAIIAYVSPFFLLVMIPLGGFFIFLYVLFTSSIREIKRYDNVTKSPLISHVTASVQGITTIYAYKKSPEFLTRFQDLLDTNSVPFLVFFTSNRWLAQRLDLITLAVSGSTGLLIIFTYDLLTPALAGLALSYAIQMTGLFQFTVRLAIETEARFTSVQRIEDYAKRVKSEAAPIVPDNRPGDKWPSQGHICYQRLQLRYREGAPLALKGVSFEVQPRERVGIVGRSGSGKSSLGVALFRLVEAASGSIVIDGLDISKIGLQDLRSKLSIIPQDPVLFVGTVRYNLDPFNAHTDQELWAALDKCHVKDTIAGLELQLEASVVENGENFSVGERQLICMARALLRHSKILMLDEATAAIDTETDALVQRTIKEAFADCSMLIIAHRLNTVLGCDKILVMENGRAVEFDRPSVLVNTPGSKFKTMLEASENTKEPL